MNKFYFGDKLKKKATATFIACLIIFFKTATAGTANLTTAETVAGSNPPGLWQKALDIFQKNSDWVPGHVSVLSEVLDRKGRPDSVTKLYFSIAVDDKGEMHSELLQAFKDGKDISAEMKKKLAISETPSEKNAKNKDTLTVSLADIPFNPERQQNVTVRANPEKQLLFDKICQRFDFSFKTKIIRKDKIENLTWVGKAWLEENSGIPLKLEFSIEPLPKRVYSLWTIYLYEITSAEDWILKKIEVQAQGGFLFIKKGFRSTTTFSDYRRQPAKEATK